MIPASAEILRPAKTAGLRMTNQGRREWVTSPLPTFRNFSFNASAYHNQLVTMPNPHTHWRSPRAHLGADVPAILRLPNGRQHRGNLETLSLSGGLLNLSDMLEQGSHPKLLFVSSTGPVLGAVEMLRPVSTTQQPFRFVAVEGVRPAPPARHGSDTLPNGSRRLGGKIPRCGSRGSSQAAQLFPPPGSLSGAACNPGKRRVPVPHPLAEIIFSLDSHVGSRQRHLERPRFHQRAEISQVAQCSGAGDPSLRLKNGSAQDDHPCFCAGPGNRSAAGRNASGAP